jgi:hypothetical protein
VVCRNSVGRFCKAASAPGKGVGPADDRPDGDVGGAATKQKAFGLSELIITLQFVLSFWRITAHVKYLQLMGHTT